MRRRSFGDFVKAFLAFAALAVLLVGVPGALATQIGWPLPSGRGLPPRTEALLDELLPAWRDAIAAVG